MKNVSQWLSKPESTRRCKIAKIAKIHHIVTCSINALYILESSEYEKQCFNA